MSGGWLDGDFYAHPKIIHAWSLHHAAIGMWSFAVSYAHKHSTGGFVSAALVMEKLPVKRERSAVVEALTSVAPGESNPLWSEVTGGWQIHNFGKRTGFRTAEQEAQLKDARSKAGSKGAAKTWQRDGKPDSKLPSAGSAFAMSDKEEEVKKPLDAKEALYLSLSERLANGILAHDAGADVSPASERWLKAIRLLVERDGRSPVEVEEVIDWCMQDGFWHQTILSAEKLRKQFTQLKLKMKQEATPVIRAAALGKESPSDLWRAMDESKATREAMIVEGKELSHG